MDVDSRFYNQSCLELLIDTVTQLLSADEVQCRYK